MHRIRGAELFVIALASAAFASAAAGAERLPIESCDVLAAHPDDPKRVRDGVSFAKLDAAAAEAACEAAIAAQPEEPRYHFQYARALHKEGRLPTALTHYRRAAELGYAAANYALALMFSESESLPSGKKKAFNAFKDAAEGGHIGAMYRLGLAYLNGEGVDRDTALAARWLRLAAAQGLVRAQLLVGRMYARGLGVPGDPAVAEEWFRRAAEQGDARGVEAYSRLSGHAVATAPAEPAKGPAPEAPPTVPASTAAKASAPPATPAPSGTTSSTGGVVARLDAGVAAYRAKDYHAAFEAWYPLAEQGVRRAEFYVGGLYMDGHGVAADKVEAYKWLKRAADAGFSPAEGLIEELMRTMSADEVERGVKAAGEPPKRS